VGASEVIGIAGSDEKCRWVESIGADKCLNYKSASFEQDLLKATEGFVDLYFDNFGGSILDIMLSRIKRYGCVVQCGLIDTYNDMKPTVLKSKTSGTSLFHHLKLSTLSNLRSLSSPKSHTYRCLKRSKQR
jgi:NADPH-dependent curcumin reductase CurA